MTRIDEVRFALMKGCRQFEPSGQKVPAAVVVATGRRWRHNGVSARVHEHRAPITSRTDHHLPFKLAKFEPYPRAR
jgi:hypothetical protein